MIKKTGICAFVLAGILWGSGSGSSGGSGGGGGGGGGVPVGNSAEVRISNELAPVGGTAQVKFGLTSPQPILTGSTGFDSYNLNGISLWSPLGDAYGLALQKNGVVSVYPVSPMGDLGTGTDYPFLTVTMNIPATIAAGTVLPVNLAAGTTLTNFAGQIAITTKPGSVTAGGSFSINEVRPGGGTWPAGTVVRIVGQGFQPNASLKTPQMQFSSYKVVSSTEIQFVLKNQTMLDAQAVQVTSGGFTQTFYAYLRGTPLNAPVRSLLRAVDPMFQQLTHAIANVGPVPSLGTGQYIALALQNPNPGPAAVTVTLTHPDGTTSSNLIVMPSTSRIMDDLAVLVGVSALQAGDVFSLASTAPIQILAINADEAAGTATPFLPSF